MLGNSSSSSEPPLVACRSAAARSCAWTTQLPAQTQQIPINLDEEKVGPYTLPDPLVTTDGQRSATAQAWTQQCRPELLRLFEDQVYGRVPRPEKPLHITSRVRSEDKAALGGTAVRREITISFSGPPEGPRLDLLLYLPKTADRVRACRRSSGSTSGGTTRSIAIPGSRSPAGGCPTILHTASRTTRPRTRAKASSSRWQVERVLARGYAIVTAYYGDIDPDYDDGFQNGVEPLFYHPGQTRPAANEWGSIAAWAWGLVRALDALESVPEIDAHQVVLHGHSRLGKTALWAGAVDPRFAVVIANESGCGGAALSRRNFGETVLRINTSFPHWFCTNFREYNAHEDRLPVDQHELIALIAPRPVLICSAAEDLWADPKGEFLAALGASPVYKLLGTDGLAVSEMPAPAPDQLVKSTIGYHIRPGKHDVTADDWDAFMNFADYHLHRFDRERQ